VSEYQYYDFRAIDRLLTKKEMGSLRSISTRAAITTTSFTNHYEWGDLNAIRASWSSRWDNTRSNFISCFQAFSGITLGLLRDKCAPVR
jgi:hypothetical protein